MTELVVCSVCNCSMDVSVSTEIGNSGVYFCEMDWLG